MKYSAPFKFKGAIKSDGDTKLYSAIASTDALDRDREVLLPKGCVTENFLKNPVMLRIHNYQHIPVGKVHAIRIDKDAVEFDFEFSDSDEGKEIEDLYVKGFMSAFSVGLYPLKALWLDDDSPKQMEVEVANGETQSFDLTKYKIAPRRLVHLWELLEISPVPVPSNPEALLLRAKDNIVRKFMSDKTHSAAAGQLLSHQLDAKMGNLTVAVKSFLSGLDDVTISKTVTDEASTECDMELAWDDSKSRAQLAKWASEDDSGDKDTMDWGKFARGFAWVDTEKADKFTSYKYPHHTVKDGELVTIWKGVTAAMAHLLGKKDVTDGSEIYEHLALHYTAIEKTAPEYGTDYSEEFLKAVEDDTLEEYLKAQEDAGDEEGDPTDTSSLEEGKASVDENALKAVFEDAVKTLQSNLDEMEETIRLRMNILVNMIEELHQDVKSFNVKSDEEGSSENEDDPSDDGKAFNENFNELSGLLQGLKGPESDDHSAH